VQQVALKAAIAASGPPIVAKDGEIALKNVEIAGLATLIDAKKLELDAIQNAKKLELDAKKLELDAIQKKYDAAMASVVVPHGAAAVPDTWVEPNVRKNVLAATGAALALSLMLVFGYEYVWGRGLPGDTAVPVQTN